MNTTPPEAMVMAHPDFFIWLFAIVLAALFAVLIYYVQNSATNNKEQWTAIDSLNRGLAHLSGKCEANHNRRSGDR